MNNLHDWAKMSTLEVNFTHKNKSYGAYDLRQRYQKHALSGLVFAAFFFLCGFGVYFANQKDEQVRLPTLEKVIPLWIDPKTKTPPPDINKPIPPPVEKTLPVHKVKFLSPKIVIDKLVKEELPDLATLQNVIQDAVNQQGADVAPISAPPVVAVLEEEKPKIEVEIPPALPPVTEEEEVLPDFVEYAEEMPAPIGGLATLQSQIVYPEMAKRANIQGRVVVQFVVDERGNVTQAKALTSIGGGCDQEAIRVIEGARFSPGMQRGRAVKVKMAIPIRFKLN